MTIVYDDQGFSKRLHSVISEGTMLCIGEKSRLDLACPVLVLHFPDWKVLNHPFQEVPYI